MSVSMSNSEFLWNYENNSLLTGIKVMGTDNATYEHSAQVLSVETLRELKAMNITVDEWNAMSDTDWQACKDRIVARAKYHPTAKVEKMTPDLIETGCELGGTYFERGYSTVINEAAQDQTINFRYSDIP